MYLKKSYSVRLTLSTSSHPYPHPQIHQLVFSVSFVGMLPISLSLSLRHFAIFRQLGRVFVVSGYMDLGECRLLLPLLLLRNDQDNP